MFGSFVARRVRAWIETISVDKITELEKVARRVRAWIETYPLTGGGNLTASHAVCVRGLKHLFTITLLLDGLSHAVCVRGLKLESVLTIDLCIKVARRVRAWIETINNTIIARNGYGRTPCACVD